ncbi:hypothetical protein SK803_25220 [Lentzea sp. BCCO 10_0856]|uniref:Uncharacterized protein n=1 Tax=Lentzea miocenica TaxID=3095431 RepID=A0ABU4T621_9PSEU|nr:hypothetical protein [Lentzea sp. BCCO 10_0856]MDX8033534.1 hypothetical protein [Lentzea sp. BCCO 10_0856]
MNHGYRLTKYDPELRPEVEQAQLDVVAAFAAESGVDVLALWTPGAYDPDPAMFPPGLLDVLHDGYEVSLADALTVVRAMLHGEAFGCQIAADDDRFVLHNSWEYFYVTTRVPCDNAMRKARESGLTVETPFHTPYFDDDEPPYPPADDAFWARVDLLAVQAGRPIAVLEQVFRGRWRWHLVNVGQRPAMAPRAWIEVFAGLTADQFERPMTLFDAGVRCDFEAVLPDADGVVRARWTL